MNPDSSSKSLIDVRARIIGDVILHIEQGNYVGENDWHSGEDFNCESRIHCHNHQTAFFISITLASASLISWIVEPLRIEVFHKKVHRPGHM